jgi:glutamate/tyrosine decarboxylase-like PLP-dependent enzyme
MVDRWESQRRVNDPSKNIGPTARKDREPFGPEQEWISILSGAMRELPSGFAMLPAAQPTHIDASRIQEVLSDVAQRLHDNYPYFHPLYAGQMLKPPHPVARLAYYLATWINPNNHALDGGRASSRMEQEVVAQLAAMFGWDVHLGHLCSGGTMANLEALWIAGQLHPSGQIVASQQAHYTHERISRVLRLDFHSVPCDGRGRLDVDWLRQQLDQGSVRTVVATIGSTSLGAVDPLPQILELREQYGFRVHADAAYGGYFGLARGLLSETQAAFECLSAVDSLVIDPHKHGLQPYGCGCVLFRDPNVSRFYRHDSPYTYFSSDALHLGEISLECSRPGAAAVALWATHRMLPPVLGGEFASMLSCSRQAATAFYRKLQTDPRFVAAIEPELDIVVWAVRGDRVSQASARARQIFQEAERRHLHLALVELPVELFLPQLGDMQRDQETITCLRTVLMKAEHFAWLGTLWTLLQQSTDAIWT